MIKVFVATPSMGEVATAQQYALRRIDAKYRDQLELHYPKECVYRMFHDHARNAMVEEFLKSECDILWFLDSDICPPTDILDIIIKHKGEWDVAGAPYPVFMTPAGESNPQIVFTVYKGRSSKGFSPANVPREGTDYVDAIATGCLFISRFILEQMERPYFEFKYDPISRDITEGEDLGFCGKVNDLGFKFFVDYSKVCKHYKKLCLLDMNNYAIDYANKSVTAYDRAIRGQVEQLNERVVQLTSAAKNKSKLILPNSLR